MKLSIRLKLSLWYTLIMLLATAMFIVVVNIVAQFQLQKSPDELFEQISNAQQEAFSERWSQGRPPAGPQDVDRIINSIRAQDLAKQRMAQVIIYLLLMGASFGVAYLIAGRLLSPLHEALRLQTEFIENASHELKTPLAISQLNLEAILHDKTMARPELEEAIREAVASTSFMNRLIEDLLLLSTTQEQVPFERVNLTELVQHSTAQLTAMANQAGRNIDVSVSTEQYYVQGNSTLLQRAVMNCIENAIKYGKQTIHVRLTVVNKAATLTVQDDGIGIAVDQLHKIGERFSRVDSSRSKQTGGSGLGVAITKGIIELHRGKFALTSVETQGTTVTITLPVAGL